MTRTIFLMGDPVLSKPVEKVAETEFSTQELTEIIADLRALQKDKNTMGLSAPQIGILKQIIVLGTKETEQDPNSTHYIPCLTLINPRIELLSRNSEEGKENCLCLPHLEASIPRFTQIRYFGFNEQGQPVEKEAFGYHARIVQHHADHVFRTLYTMRIRDFTKFSFQENHMAQYKKLES